MQEYPVHPAPPEIMQQAAQPPLRAMQIDVVPEARFHARARNARLLRIELPGVEIEHRRLPVDGVYPADERARQRIWQQPEVAASAGGQVGICDAGGRYRNFENAAHPIGKAW